jgi:hypothetical protein
MGDITNPFTKAASKLSTLDIISLATAIPLSAVADPMRPLNKIFEATMPETDIGKPSEPPPAPTILTDTTSTTLTAEEKKRRAGLGRSSTVSAGSLSDATTYKPTLLGQ